jgi:hypothetical protein
MRSEHLSQITVTAPAIAIRFLLQYTTFFPRTPYYAIRHPKPKNRNSKIENAIGNPIETEIMLTQEET